MRVMGGKAERGVDPRLQLLRERVFEAVGLGMHLIDRHAERLCEVLLEQPVVADHLHRRLAPAEVSFTPRYGSCTTSFSVASFFSIDVTDGGETPSDAASAEVVARPCSDSSRWISLR